MLAGESGALGPGDGIEEAFADFTSWRFLAEPSINDENSVLFLGLLRITGKGCG